MAALASLSPSGQRDRTAAHEHALGLGAGAEARLGFAEAAVRAGRASDGPVYAAALRCVREMPLCAAAHQVLGVVSEARAAFQEALAAYRTSLALLQDYPAGGALAPTRSGAASPGAPSPVLAARLGVARALLGSGEPNQAALLYRDLAAEVDLLSSCPDAVLDYARAVASLGNLRDAAGILASLLPSSAPLQIKLEALSQRWAYLGRALGPEETLDAAEADLQTLPFPEGSAAAQLQSVTRASTRLAALGARSGDSLLVDRTKGLFQQWAGRHGQPLPSEVVSDLFRARMLSCSHQKASLEAARMGARGDPCDALGPKPAGCGRPNISGGLPAFCCGGSGASAPSHRYWGRVWGRGGPHSGGLPGSRGGDSGLPCQSQHCCCR
eukprot:jgi/Botrbrau1/13377/Bobra.0194s0009.1